MKVQNYLNFIDQKYDALTNLQHLLTDDLFNFLSPALKTILIYMGTVRYVTHTKKLIRSLKYKNLKFPNE